MKFQLMMENSGNATLTIEPENDGERLLLTGLAGKQPETRFLEADARATFEFSQDRAPYKKVIALKVQV